MRLIFVFGLLLMSQAGFATPPAKPLPLEKIKLPAGFSISIFAENVENARSLALGSSGIIFVSTRKLGHVYALVDSDGDFRAEKVYKIGSGMNSPNGIAFKDGSLYVAEINRILRFDQIEKNLANPPKPVVVTEQFPKDGHHGWKFIAFGPDNKLYVPVGAPCNICNNEDTKPIYAAIHRINPDGTGLQTVAKGVRNTVGFTWHPVTGQLWFTDNGRDWMGDDIPPCELNVVSKEGEHFGYPFLHGAGIKDPEFGNFVGNRVITPPARSLDAHVAPLGVKFYTGSQFPESYRNNVAFIAEHGSWNRAKKIGYRVMMVKTDGTRGTSYEPFASGWLDDKNDQVWGRPVDLLQLPDGSMLVSDDFANVVYRITHNDR